MILWNRRIASPIRSRLRRRLLIERLQSRDLLTGAPHDFLYIGDSASDSIKQFDADTGAYIGSFVPPGSAGLHGPRGMVFDQGNLLLVNQNIDQTVNGEVLRFNGATGTTVGSLVPSSNPNAPFAPAGMVVKDNVVYVADTGEGSPTGRIAMYDATSGSFQGAFVPSDFGPEFRPRGLVFGPDGGLYVTVSSIQKTDTPDPPGHILRIDVKTGADRVVAWNDGDGVDDSKYGEAVDLHNPLGITFAKDGTMYVTCNRKDMSTSADRNTQIVKIDPLTRKELGHFELVPEVHPESTRYFAQSLVFGPGNKLFIPITVESIDVGTTSGAVLTYDPVSDHISTFHASSTVEPSLASPSYLIFGQSDGATLAYVDAPIPAATVLSRIEATPISFASKDSSTLLTRNITIGDKDSDTLSSATIRVSSNYHSGEDELIFTNTPNIQGTWNSSTGILSLVGDASLDAFQTALRSVRYQNKSTNISAGHRLIEFQVFDGGFGSNLLTRPIHVSMAISDTLFFGDQGDPTNTNDDRIKRFDFSTGQSLGDIGAAGQFIGPRGVVLNQGDLLAVNQNVNQPSNGEVLRFDPQSGTPHNPLISPYNSHAPFAPRGMVVKDNVLYVADAEGPSNLGSSIHPINKYDATTGEFLGDLVPKACFGFEVHPRGLVFGSDGYLYASYFSTGDFSSSNPLGLILRFVDTTTGAFEVVAKNLGGQSPADREIADLNNPEGIVFGPDGLLYTTSYHENSAQNGIVILNVQTKSQVGFIPLGAYYAQSLLFGPNDQLYVPVSGGGEGSGSVRVFDPASGDYNSFTTLFDGDLQQPWYLTFTHTDPATLAYHSA
jgi:glucose/arabinose dehydrogenase